ncbi:MAG TPA: GAF domain-containing protein, partial [Candidatus Acidoferrum sp.]|nr:GAF domain-containing protein [Candidatus Acidoferrum sp.]
HIGQPAVFETYFAPLKRHFTVSATSPQPGQFVTVFEDITDRKRMEEDLRRSNQRLDLLAETAGRLLAADSPQEVVESLCLKVMKFIHCDEFFNFLVAPDQEGILHLNAYAGISEEEAQRLERLEYGVAVCGIAARDAHRIVCEDILNIEDPLTELMKSKGIQAYACHPLMVGGRVLGTLSFGTRQRTRFAPDELSLMNAVADQVAIALDRQQAGEALKQSEESLRESEERFRTMANAIPQLAWIAKSDGFIFWYNDRWYDYTGTTPEQMEGWGWQSVHDPEVLPQVLEQWKAALATGEPFDMVFPLRGADGQFRPFLTRVMPLKDESGKVIRWF